MIYVQLSKADRREKPALTKKKKCFISGSLKSRRQKKFFKNPYLAKLKAKVFPRTISYKKASCPIFDVFQKLCH